MLFRNRRVVRAIACYLLLQSVSSLVFPAVSLAMMGPSQPEFTSYEAPGATDLVNLVTGDFSYSIPVLDVPGPERSFSLPLSYKSGIELEQEASWVGLGWSLNAGAISRTVNGYADDANGDVSDSRFLKRLADVHTTTYILGIFTYVEEKYSGKSFGTVDLIGLASVNWDNDGITGGDLVGIGYQKGQGPTVDPVRLALAVVTIATLGGASVATVATNIGIRVIEQGVMSAAIGLTMNAFAIGRLGGVPTYDNHVITYTGGDYIDSDTYSVLHNMTKERAYGSLYFDKLTQQTANTGSGLNFSSGGNVGKAPEFVATRDCSSSVPVYPGELITQGPGIYLSETVADVHQSSAHETALSIAHDYFSVMGESVSGSIRPYRLDVGSVAYPGVRSVDCDNHHKYAPVPFQSYKAGFRYEGSLSNKYEYHQNGQDIGFQISANNQSVTITDQRLFNSNARIETSRTGLVNPGSINQRLVQGKHVVWYSNAEIEQMTGNASTTGFIDFASPISSAGTTNDFRHQLPPSGIGAFAVTAEDGTTYHYSLPVY